MTAESGSRRVRWALAASLLVLAPVCAEYVTGYDTSTGNPLALATGLLIFGPLYGAPALVIRETARRLHVRLPGAVLLGVLAIRRRGSEPPISSRPTGFRAG